MPTGLIKYLTIIPFLLVFYFLPAQNQNLLKNFLTVDEGLSHNEVTSIVQDHDGFIWIGTRGGLNRYDGYDFKIFNQIPGDSNSLVNPSIESLFVDGKGNIWIGTKSGGVSKYDPDSEIFKNIKTNYKHKSPVLPDNRILAFAEDEKGRIWMGTWGNGVIIYDEEKDTSLHFLGNTLVNSIIKTKEGKIWVGTNSGLFEYRESPESFIQRNQPPHFFACQDMHYDEQRNVLWIASGNNEGIVKFNLENNTWIGHRIGDSFGTNTIHAYESVFLDGNGKVWLGTWGTGFYTFDQEKEAFERYLIYPGNRATLNKDYDAVLEIFQDRDKNIWLGTNGGGVCVLTPKLEFHTVGFHPEPNKGLINTRIMSVVDGRDGNLWLGTIGSGLIWSPDRENFYTVQYPDGINKSRFFIIKFLYEDDSGRVWVGTNVGTFFIQFQNGVPKMVIPQKVFINSGFRSLQVVSILDTKNFLWLGSLMSGLLLLDNQKEFGEVKYLTKDTPESGNLNSNRISFLLQDTKERIWIGTYNGLHIFNPLDTTIQIAEEYFDIIGDFTGNIITCVDEDKKGNIWIGTPNGLNRLKEKNPNQFELNYFTEEDGLASNFVKGISHDSEGNVWVSTNLGITKLYVDADTISVVNYNEMDGVGGKNFTEASVFRNDEGELFFGGNYGLTYFHPSEINALPFVHKPVFTGLKIFNQPVAINQKFGSEVILDHSLLHDKEIRIPYRFNNFEIQFSALDYKSMGRNNYKYFLENLDEKWNYVGKRRFVNFNNLKPGEYVLKVKSSNSHNVWNEEPTELIIKILPPFWQTWYALIFYILAVVGIVSVIRWNAVKQVRLANSLEMEKMQHEQDRKIAELKFQFFTNISHEFRTPLTLILAPLKEILSKGNRSQLTEEVSGKIQIVQKNADRLMKLVNQLLDFRKAETGNMKLTARKSDIENFVKEVCFSFYELAKINEIKFTFHSKIETKNIWFDLEKMEIILNNLISNAFKFTKQKGVIEVNLFEEEEEILLSVSDSGPGISATEIKHIFDRFYRIERGDSYGSSGIGLSLVKRLVELHHGNISVTSQQNVNTEFVVSLPKGNSHLSAEEMISEEKSVADFVRNEPVFAGIFPARSKTKPKSDQCILIVEDDKEVNDYLENLLHPLYVTETAFDGLEGYYKALKLKPHLIISDVMMPKMDGFELCEKIKTNEELTTIPFILLTAKNAENFKLLGIQTGADEYISKPFDPHYLIEKIHNLLFAREKLQKQYSKSVRLEPSDVEITHAEEVFIEKTISIIENNLQNHQLSSDFLARELNMSNSSLYRKLKEMTDFSTAEFIRSIRTKRAAQLLADKERTITEIAFEVGFNDVKHFRTVFQKQFGCSPTEYREKL